MYGGGSRKNQINVVTKGVEIVVATPGRLNDLIMNGFIDITTVSYLVSGQYAWIAKLRQVNLSKLYMSLVRHIV